MARKSKLTHQKPQTPKKYKFETIQAGFYEYHPSFSFKHYEHNHREYSAKHIDDSTDFHVMFERLTAMAQFTWKNIKIASHVYHFHPIKWELTSEPHGFKDLMGNSKEQHPAWQFKSFKECRIIGFFNQYNIFEVVWVDRKHKVYPQK